MIAVQHHLKTRKAVKRMDEFRIGQRVRVVSEEDVGKVVGHIGDMVLVRFSSGFTDKYYPHELFYEEE